MRFDGRKFAEAGTAELVERKPVHQVSLCIVQVGEDKPSDIFVNLKIKKGLELGVVVEHIKLEAGDIVSLRDIVEERNKDESVSGLMVQLPVLGVEKEEVLGILNKIDPKKDADGQGERRLVLPAAVRAVRSIVEEHEKNVGKTEMVAVVGALGRLGRSICEWFEGRGSRVLGLDKGDGLGVLREADLVVLCSGQEGVVGEESLKQGAGVIDLGAPKAEFVEKGLGKVSFLTPVPGGVGPVTVVSLYENLFDLVFEPKSAKIS